MEIDRETSRIAEQTKIASIVGHEFGINEFEFQRLNTGETNDVYKITVNNQNLLLKIVSDLEKSGVYKQSILYPSLQQAGIPIPRRLVALKAIPITSYGYIIDEWVEGNVGSDMYGALIERPVDDNVVSNMQAILQAIHSISIAGYGDINLALTGEYLSWNEFLSSFVDLEDLKTARVEGLVPALLLDRVEAFLKESPVPNYREESRLVHGDFNLKNILVKEDNIVSIVDWDDSVGGDPLWDYARMQLWFEDRLPLYKFIESDYSVTGNESSIEKNIAYYKILLAVREAIDFGHHEWVRDAFQRLEASLQEVGY